MACQVQPGFPQHKKSLEFEREQGDRRQEAQAYLESGETYRSENKNQKAIEQYEKAINIARKQGDTLCETIAYLKLGETYRSDNKNQIAITQYENSLEIARKQEYKLHETIAYVRLGESYRSDNTNEKAIQQYEKALEIARKQGYKLQIAIAYLGLGEAYKSDCQNQKTFEYNRKALEIAKEQGYKLRKTQAYIGLGHAYRFDNNNQEAIRHYEKALETARKQGYKLEETQAYLGLAEAHKVHSQNERAIQHHAKALEIANEKGYKQEKDHAYVGLTEALTASKELSGFADYQGTNEEGLSKNVATFQESEPEIIDAVDGHYGAIANVPDSAQLQDTKLKNSDSDDRLDMKNESSTDDRTISKQQLFTGHSNPDGGKNEYVIVTVPLANKRERKDSKVKAYQQWGNTVTRKGEYKKGIEYYEKARKISPDLRPDEMEVAAYQWLGYNQLQAGQYQESIKYYSAVVTFATLLGDKRRKLNAYLGLGGALIYTGDFKSSQKYYQEALKIAKELCDKRCEGISYLGLGSVCNKEFDYENAEKWFKLAQHIFQTKHIDESLKGKAFMGSRIAKFNAKNMQKGTKTILRAGNFFKDKTKKGVKEDKMSEKVVDFNESEPKFKDCYTEEETKSFCKGGPITGRNGDEMSKDEAVFQESDPKSKATKSNKEDIPHNEEKICQRFEDSFVDSKYKLKKEVHEKLTCFPWLSGAYGLTAPTKKIARPHIYLTVKRGMKKSDVRRDLEDKFKCDAKLYFELLQEPTRKPTIEYLGKCASTLRPKWMKSSSLLPAPGGGVLACVRDSSNTPNYLRVPQENERHDLPEEQGTGTLTMFYASNNEHYALTCFHVGCATDETQLNATLNKKEDIEAIRSSLPTYVQHAMEQQYYFAEKVAANNNDLISFGDDGRKYTQLGDFHNYRFDNNCDIMSLKIAANTKIKCEMTGVASPNWYNIWKELYKRVYNHDTVNVEKTGFSSDVSYGRIISCDVSYKLGAELLFQNALAVKGYNGPFLKGGDSGCPVFFEDKNDRKQIFAYGVCEMDELPIIKRHESISSSSHKTTQAEKATTFSNDNSDDDNDNSSAWSEDESDDSEIQFQEDSGGYFICLRLDTALEELELQEAAICVSECSLKR